MHLETAGAHPRALAEVLDPCGHVSLDLKPDSDLDTAVELQPTPSKPSPRTPAEWSRTRRECLSLVSDRDLALRVVPQMHKALRLP